MAIADLINDRRAKDRAKLYNQGYALGYYLGYAQGYSLGYARGYADARNGRPRRMEAASGDLPSPDSETTPFRPRRRSLRRRRNLRYHP